MPQTAPAAPLALETEGLNYLLEDRERLIAELHTAYATQRQLSEELSSLKSLQHQNKLIPIEYGYQPSCRNQHWAKTPSLQKLTQHMRENEPTYTAQLARFARHIPHFTAIALNESDCLDATRPFWLNDWIPALDAITLYGYLVEKNPRFYVEVGSGNSTKFVRQAIKDHHLRTRIISIDPAPRAEIDFVCDDIIRKPLENVDLTFFKMLTAEDMVFIDNSHIAFMNTDVTVFFCEILGSLPAGLLFGLHDIYLPFDYPDSWAGRWYNEQYLLLTYLMGGAQGDKIILPTYYMASRPETLAPLAAFSATPSFEQVPLCGGIFWMEKAPPTKE